MNTPHRPTARVSKSRGRASRLTRVFLMSGLGAIVLGAAFWPPEAVQRRLAVRLTFAEGLSERDRQAQLADVQAAVVDKVDLAHWAADADVEAKPKPFVFARIAQYLPTAVRAETTLDASPIESDGKLTGVEVTFADSDGLRAERFAQAIVRTFEESTDVSTATSETTPAAAETANAESEEALASIRREQDQLRKSLEEHFQELRALRSELSDEVENGKAKKAETKKSTAGSAGAAGNDQVSTSLLRPAELTASTQKNVLWQVSPSLSHEEIALRIEALEADIAVKKDARAELLGKFTAHHPVAAALGVAVERLERELRDLQGLLAQAQDSVPTPPAVAPQSVPAPQSTAPRPNPAPAASRPAVVPAPAAPIVRAPNSAAPPASESKPAPSALPDESKKGDDEAAAEAATAAVVANKKAIASALERAIRSEEALQGELRTLAEASRALSRTSSIADLDAASGSSNVVATGASSLHAEIVDLEESESVENRFALLVAGSMLFACLMTGLTWAVSRERAVVSADEVRRASGLPVVGQSTAGLLDRKPTRSLASVAVSGSLKIVEGAAFATAVFCVAALAAENPRCEQILRQPLAIAWQALQSLT